MRLGQFRGDDDARPWCGVVTGEQVVNVSEAGRVVDMDLPRTTRALLGTYRWQDRVEIAVDAARRDGTGVYALDDLRRAAPLTSPEKIVCVGLNYQDHADEVDLDLPEEPVLFSKFPTSIVGPNDDVVWDPDVTEEVDYEAELVAVVGDRARNVTPDEAMDYVAGYTVGNDVSARDLQFSDDQWVRGKSLDTFAPIGPSLVTRDAVPDPHDLDIWADVNGERLQDSTTDHLIFGVDELVSFCSRMFTLTPGDLIFTGTPAGVGMSRDPPVHLAAGDEVTVGVEQVGELTNECAYR